MADDNQIQSSDKDQRKQAIAHRLSELSFAPVSTDVELQQRKAIKLPFDKLSSLGVGFSSLPEAFRTVTQVVDPGNGAPLFRAILPEGATLNQAKNGLFSSSAQLADGTAAWAKYQAVNPITVTTTMPFDPASLAMATAFAAVNQKLDHIQSTLDEMFDYLRLKDKANIRASLDTLATILNDYKFNWNNDQFKQAKYILVQSINRDARQHITELRAQLSQKIEKKGFFELRGQTEDSAEQALDLMKDYRFATYLYAFSTFLGVMLLENYDQDYLESKAADIRQKALEYREAYTNCFNAIQSRSQKSADAFVLGGLSAGIKSLGSLIKQTPIGDVTPIDEALIDAGSDIQGFTEGENDRIPQLLVEAKDPAVAPFAESIDEVNRVYNHSTQLLADGEAIYVLVADE